MAFTPEEKVARQLARVFDSLSLDTQTAAKFTIANMGWMMQSKFFDFIMYCLAEFYTQDSQQQPYRHEIIKVIYDAMEDKGYTAYTYPSSQKLCGDCGSPLDGILSVDDCPNNFQNHN